MYRMIASLYHFMLYGSSTLGSFAPASVDVCKQIESSISCSSAVYYPGTANYTLDVNHWSEASMQPSLCSVEPASAKDVGAILRILGATRTPFAVKGGGHATNPRFSDTAGVQITMSRFSDIDYDVASQTVTIGTGLLWDDVYSALEAEGRTVVGGRVAGVGVAGLALGGGYSWLTNQHGLALDNIQSFELVKPDGNVSEITHQSDHDLFFAVKGTQNNFGIVTKMVLKTFPQGQVWGGPLSYTADQVDSFNAATLKFTQEVTDPKAQLITSYIFSSGVLTLGALVFYDAPTVPDGIFDDFVNLSQDGSAAHTRNFAELVSSFPASEKNSNRTTFHTVPIAEHSAPLLEAFVNETLFWGHRLSEVAPSAFLVYYLEPFLPSFLSFNPLPTAYPPFRSIPLFPSCLQYAWPSPDLDDLFFDAIRQSQAHIVRAAVADGQKAVLNGPRYPNYALYDTPVELIFGENLNKLRSIKKRVDPGDVMGLAGGFKV